MVDRSFNSTAPGHWSLAGGVDPSAKRSEQSSCSRWRVLCKRDEADRPMQLHSCERAYDHTFTLNQCH